MMIKGISVILHQKTQIGTDDFNRPIYEDSTVTVNNVIVTPSSEQEVIDTLDINGRKAVYTLGIPKGDSHDWEDTIIEFFGQQWHSIGMPTEGIEEMIPLDWNKKVRVERYG